MTQPCKNAIMRLLLAEENIEKALILSAQREHAFLLKMEDAWSIAIKSGFASGYSGEGSRGLAEVINVLDAFGVDIDEVEISKEELAQLDACRLTFEEVQAIGARKPLRPKRLWDYTVVLPKGRREIPVDFFEPVISFAVLDQRLHRLAIEFRNDPDAALFRAYRTLEEKVRERTGLKTHGQRLFSDAFLSKSPRLGWEEIDDGERAARGQLFTSIFGAYRNARAHRTNDTGTDGLVREFHLINELYCLESEAIDLEPEAEIGET